MRLSIILHIILHHAGLELAVPAERKLFYHPAIQHDIKRRQKKHILLDLAVHHDAIPSAERHQRGRPDIVHFYLLEAFFTLKLLDEIEDKISNQINLFIHTRNDLVMKIPPDWRIPVSYLRFRGLMEQFLAKKKLLTKTIIPLEFHEQSLSEIIQTLEPTRIIECTTQGSSIGNDFFKILFHHVKAREHSWVILIGGYQKGTINLPRDIFPIPEKLALFATGLPAWKILAIILERMIR